MQAVEQKFAAMDEKKAKEEYNFEYFTTGIKEKSKREASARAIEESQKIVCESF